MTRSALIVLLCSVFVVSACRDASEQDIDTSKPSDFGFQVSTHTALVNEGREAYARYCAGCHGDTGNGWGPAARFFHPRPRNFTLGNFKFSSTRSGEMPTDPDLRRTITKGLKGSAMPPFDLLSARTVDGLIAYIKTMSPKWAQRGLASTIPIVEDPYRELADKSTAIARGEAVYHGFATCWTCHPAYVSEDRINTHIVSFGGRDRDVFRPGLRDSVGKATGEGEFIYPTDFHRDFARSGAALVDLYRVIGAGITGTAMPTWIDSIDIPGADPQTPVVQPSDIWAMAYYVQSLMAERPPKLAMGSFQTRERAREILPAGSPKPEPPSDDAEEEDDFWDDEESEDEESEDEQTERGGSAE